MIRLDYNTGYYDGYALNGIDFVSASPYPIHFEAGSATAELRLTTFRDDEAEGSETTGVYLVENGSGYIVGTRTASATVYDPPVVTAEATTASVTEGDTLVFTLHRTGDLNQSLDVDYAYLDYNTGYYDGYALNGIDFLSASPYPIHFEAGSATAELRLTTFRDDEAEGSETTGVYLVENGSGYIIGTRTASATIHDPDSWAPGV